MCRFKIKPYPFAELAQMYYPDHHYDSALRHFREEMHLTRGLWEAMRAVGYREKQKTALTLASEDHRHVPGRAVRDKHGGCPWGVPPCCFVWLTSPFVD